MASEIIKGGCNVKLTFRQPTFIHPPSREASLIPDSAEKQENRGRKFPCSYSNGMIFYLLRRSAKTCQRDGFIRNQVVGVDAITARSGTAEELFRGAIVYRLPSGEWNYPEVTCAAGVSRLRARYAEAD